jgi:hypothetical protein
MDFITADGGFDFSLDFNKQEISISKLLFAQVCFAVTLQKKGGTFVLKIFDCFMEHTVDILYILSSFYDKVYITKPQTSRYANSEKYIVCKDFLFSNNDHFYPFLHSAFQKMSGVEEHKYVHRFLNIPLSYYFTIKLEEYNAIFGQQQIENIHYTISLIENKQKHEKQLRVAQSRVHLLEMFLAAFRDIFITFLTSKPEDIINQMNDLLLFTIGQYEPINKRYNSKVNMTNYIPVWNDAMFTLPKKEKKIRKAKTTTVVEEED